MRKSLFENGVRPQRRQIPLSGADPVEIAPLWKDDNFGRLLRPAFPGVDLCGWTRTHRDKLATLLLQHGALVFRGFAMHQAEDLKQLIEAGGGEPLPYKERSSPRHQVADRIYTSTDYPADQSILPHNEHSYSAVFPMKLYFFCRKPAASGGATPIVDGRALAKAIPAEIGERFARLGWMYVRNFGEGIGLSWPTVFQTENRAEVDAYCRANQLRYEWKDNNRLRTKLVRPAWINHPHTGERLWFNHATFFHISSLSKDLSVPLRRQYAEDALPNNTFFGDGTPIPDEVAAQLRAAYAQACRRFTWQRGDVLLLDNILTGHARDPYQGDREILVGMADPFRRENTTPVT